MSLEKYESRQINPDDTIFIDDFTIHPDGDNRIQDLLNIFLILFRSRRRWRTITYEDRVVTTMDNRGGFLATPEQAIGKTNTIKMKDKKYIFP